MWLHPVGNLGEISAIMPDPLLRIAMSVFIHQRSLAFWLSPVHHVAAWGSSCIAGISMRPHGRDSALRAPPIDADTVTGDPHFIHFLNDRVISPYSVAVWSHLEPGSALVIPRVLWSAVDVHSVTIPREVELLHLLEDIHFYLQATYNYSRSVTPLESMTTIA